MLAKFKSRVNDQGAKCPAFDELLDAVFANVALLYSEEERAGLISYIWELFGYVIYPPKTVAVFMFWIGGRDSGMIQVVDVLRNLVGAEAVFDGKAKKFLGNGVSKSKSAEKLEGKLLFVDDNVERGTRLCDGVLKTFSENKGMGVYSGRGRDRIVETTATPLLCTDTDHLRFIDDSYAFERRTHAIYFDSAIDIGRAKLLAQTAIQDEMPGVLNKALCGLGRVRERHALADPASVVDFRKRFLDVAIIRGNRPRGATRSPHIANPSIP